MAPLIEEPSRINVCPDCYLEEHWFRSTRLDVRDLEAIAAEVGDATQRWTCFVPETLDGPEHVRRRSLLNWTRGSLGELAQVAPGGRIFHFEFETTIDGTNIRLTMGRPWSKTHRSILSTSHDPDVKTSEAYFKIADIIYASAKRGRLWHYLSSTACAIAIVAVAKLWFLAFSFYKNVPGQAGGAAGFAVAATFLTAFFLLIFSPLWVEALRRLTASSIKLKPNAVVRKAGSGIRRLWAWIRLAYSRDGNLEYKTYLATHLGWIFGAVSMVFAVLAWLFPRGK